MKRTQKDTDARAQAQAGTSRAEVQTIPGKTLLQLQAEQMARRMFADMMSSAGVGAHRMGQELFYMMPRGFLDAYEALWIRAFGGKDDGGVNQRGQAAADAGALMKGKTAVRGGGGKKYKRYWTIADEKAVRVKELVDRRLRALAREIDEEISRSEMEDDEGRGGGKGGGKGEGRERKHCTGCGRLIGAGWKFCPFDGHRVDGD